MAIILRGERISHMLAAKLKGMVTEDHRLELTLPSSIPPGEVEIIILHPEQPKKPKARVRKSDPNVHPAAGLWADRKDLDNPIAFVSQLRHRLETRRDTRA
jgi:hypothetical protein